MPCRHGAIGWLWRDVFRFDVLCQASGREDRLEERSGRLRLPEPSELVHAERQEFQRAISALADWAFALAEELGACREGELESRAGAIGVVVEDLQCHLSGHSARVCSDCQDLAGP